MIGGPGDFWPGGTILYPSHQPFFILRVRSSRLKNLITGRLRGTTTGQPYLSKNTIFYPLRNVRRKNDETRRKKDGGDMSMREIA